MVSAARIGQMLLQMAEASLKANGQEVEFGHPCSHLIREGMRTGVNAIAEKMLHGDSHGEFSLNGASLKLFWERHQHGIYLTIGGDQAKHYPATVSRIEAVLKQWGFDRRPD